MAPTKNGLVLQGSLNGTHFEGINSLSQWLNFKLLGITYLVGKISRSNFFFQGPGRLTEFCMGPILRGSNNDGNIWWILRDQTHFEGSNPLWGIKPTWVGNFFMTPCFMQWTSFCTRAVSSCRKNCYSYSPAVGVGTTLEALSCEVIITPAASFVPCEGFQPKKTNVHQFIQRKHIIYCCVCICNLSHVFYNVVCRLSVLQDFFHQLSTYF